MITLDNPRLVKFINDKDTLVQEGRKITRDIENLEVRIKGFENREKAITAKVKPSIESIEKGNKLTDEINAKIKELETLGMEIENQKLAAVPAKMKEDHLNLLKQKETLERDRNKIALKIQKIKDKIVPIIQKECKPLLKNEFDDIETASIKDDKIVIKTFNHVEDFKSKFRKR